MEYFDKKSDDTEKKRNIKECKIQTKKTNLSLSVYVFVTKQIVSKMTESLMDRRSKNQLECLV